jgi:alpha-ketoglutarate-dependent taurine dioxygenase
MGYTKLVVDDSIGPVGAEVTGIDLSVVMMPGVREVLHAAWLKHHILFFRDQMLNPAEQASFAANFGDLDIYPFMKAVDSHPNVIPIIKEADATMNYPAPRIRTLLMSNCHPGQRYFMRLKYRTLAGIRSLPMQQPPMMNSVRV